MPEKTRQLWVAIVSFVGGNDWYSSAFAPLREPHIMLPMQYDVLIAGAGPAGSFAAELLAKSGAKVALFDGRPAGEPKACGGGVTAKALKAWPHLLNAVGRTVDELDLYSPSSKRLHLVLDERGN